MKSAAVLMLVLLAGSCAATAKPYHGHRHSARTPHHAHRSIERHHVKRATERESHSGITCDMVRAYVAQVGLAQAIAMAQTAGITASARERARRCLAEKT